MPIVKLHLPHWENEHKPLCGSKGTNTTKDVNEVTCKKCRAIIDETTPGEFDHES